MSKTCSYCQRPAALCHATALMKEPPYWRGLLHGPAGGFSFRVDGSDNWGSVAAQDGWSARDLIYYNFRTHDPREINWFLYHFVGCRHSQDGKNLTFRNARPGIIYTRRKSTGYSGVAPTTAFSFNYSKIVLEDVMVSSYSL